jgi:glycosyltransferase involved in cell wall biosynthesis
MTDTARTMPRVLVSGVVLGQPMGGVRRHNAELLPRAARVLARGGGGLGVMEGRERVAFDLPEPIERFESDVPAGPPLRRSLAEKKALCRVLDEAREDGKPFDLVHTAHLPAPRGLPVPYTYTIHDLRSLELDDTPLPRRLVAGRVIGEAVQGASCVITVSEGVKLKLLRRFDLDPDRVFVVPNGYNHLPFHPRVAPEGAPLLHVGHLEPRKNLDLLLHALALDPTLPDLWLVGNAKEGEEERLRTLATHLDVAERLRFVGEVDDDELALLYSRVGCVVFPSRLEGFGIPAVEAMIAHVPLAVSNAEALLEVTGGEVASFSADDPQGCAAAIQRALRSTEMELASLALRSERYSWQESADRLIAAWRGAYTVPRR